MSDFDSPNNGSNIPTEQVEDTVYVSKSALKKEMTKLQKMGEDLVDLPERLLEKISLPADIHEAIMLARRLKNREGKRRQLQYIGKLMRKTDVDPIRQQLEKFQQQSRSFRQHFHQLEQWRDRLIDEGDSALNALLNEYPSADRQHLRQLIRQAKKESSQNKPPAASRKVFQYLKGLLES